MIMAMSLKGGSIYIYIYIYMYISITITITITIIVVMIITIMIDLGCTRGYDGFTHGPEGQEHLERVPQLPLPRAPAAWGASPTATITNYNTF